jgi:hypothetical protein
LNRSLLVLSRVHHTALQTLPSSLCPTCPTGPTCPTPKSFFRPAGSLYKVNSNTTHVAHKLPHARTFVKRKNRLKSR